MIRSEFIAAVIEEVERAYAKHGHDKWGRHEFYAVMKEEVDEVWDDVKNDAPQEHLLKEVVQVAAMCLRYVETGDRYRTKEIAAHFPEAPAWLRKIID